MALSELDNAIMTSIQSVVCGQDFNGDDMYCAWLPAMRTRENDILVSFENKVPVLIQYIEDKETPAINRIGQINTIIEFYFVNPRTEDALQTREIHRTLNNLALEFQRKLAAYFRCEFIGNREKFVDQLASVKEAGIYFTMQVTINQPC